MSYQARRDEFVARLAKENVPESVARKVLREAATMVRLGVASANADYPYNIHVACNDTECRCWKKGEPRRCCWCGFMVAGPAVTMRLDKRNPHPSTADHACCAICDNCRAEERLRKVLAPFKITPVRSDLNVRLHMPSGADEGVGGVYVPARRA